MNVKYLNPIFAAFKDTAVQVLGAEPIFDRPYLKDTPFNSNDLLVIIGITGGMVGKTIINLDRLSCVKIASQMMGGVEMIFDDLTKSAIGELFNMAMGTAATYLEGEGMNINITTPTVIEGDNLTISQKERIISVPVNIESVNLTVSISAEIRAA